MVEFSGANLKQEEEPRIYFRFPIEGEALLVLETAEGSLTCAGMELGVKGMQSMRSEGLEVKPIEVKPLLPAVAQSAEPGDTAKDSAAAQEPATATNPVTSLVTSPATSLVASPAASKERRQDVRYAVSGRARVRFFSLHTQYMGRIEDLSMSGCRVSFAESMPMSALRRRVEVEFEVNGMTVMMSGLTQAMHNRHTFGIRFVEVTEHKLEHLRIVIAEVEHRMTLQGGPDAQRCAPARSRCISR